MKTTLITSTPFGPVGLVWTMIGELPRIRRILLPRPRLTAEAQLRQEYANLPASAGDEIAAVITMIKAFLDGADIRLPLALVDLSGCSPFQQSVLRADYQIPRGSVSTYQLLARHLGRPNGARAVGNVMADNPFPLIVPCHRVIRSDGHLGGFQSGLALKRALLEKEGVIVDETDHVSAPNFHYR